MEIYRYECSLGYTFVYQLLSNDIIFYLKYS